MARKARKYWLGLVCASQSPADCLESHYGPAIVNNSRTWVLLGLVSKALEAARTVMKLTDREAATLEHAQPGQALVLCRTLPRAVRLFLTIRASAEEEWINSTTPAELAERNRERRAQQPPAAAATPPTQRPRSPHSAPRRRRSAPRSGPQISSTTSSPCRVALKVSQVSRSKLTHPGRTPPAPATTAEESVRSAQNNADSAAPLQLLITSYLQRDPLGGCLGEHVSCNLVAVERSRSTGVGLNVDEKLDDLLFGDAIVECNSQLSAQRFMRAQYRRDRHRDQCATAGVQARSRPGISKRMPRSKPFEVVPNRGLSGPSGNTSGTPSRRSAAAYAS